MGFTAPQYFWLLLLLLPLVWRVLATERFLSLLRFRFRSDVYGRTTWRSYGRCLLPLLALVGLVTALAGPSITVLRAGKVSDNLVLAIGIDVSKSMLAEDVILEPQTQQQTLPIANRLNAARQLILTLLGRLDGGKVGLYFFARNGIEVVSPTRDIGFLRYMATHTDLGELTESGSNLFAALDTGVTMVDSQTGTAAAAILLISDGEDTENSLSDLGQAVADSARMRIPVFTVGTGQSGAVHIPIRRQGGTGIEGFYTDSDGLPLKTRLDEQALQKIATATGGRYFRLVSNSSAELAEDLARSIVNVPASHPETLPEQPLPVDLAPAFLLATLLCYCLYLLL